jgi:hypothetical protein
MILRWMDKRWWYRMDLSGSGEGPIEGCFERGNEPSGSIKLWEVLERLHNWRSPEKGSVLKSSF